MKIKIAIYGKGGIGKSTVAANLSAALAKNGHRILQIGCDPKHDSTRLLLGGKIPLTALEYIRTTLPEQRNAGDIVYRGYGDVACVEAGGPEPGVGCAGRGIITTFELLEDLGISPSLFDITLYDVLGDVVCGGFAVPIRDEYADAVYIVTSGEYLSLYAANNILRGVKNYTETKNRVAGIIFNARNVPEEEERVRRFSEAVHLPVVIRIPRSGIFGRAEKEGGTLIERYPDGDETGLFRTLASHAEGIIADGGASLHPALPLSDDDLERIVLSRQDPRPANKFVLPDAATATGRCRKCISPAVKNKRPLFGCAFAGAIAVTANVSDAATVMHCPRSCALMIAEKLVTTAYHAALRSHCSGGGSITDRLMTTDMTDTEFIFGGEKKLAETLECAIQKGYRTLFVITACPPGIIGDDIGKVSAAVIEQHPDIRIIPVKVDGNLVGDGLQGRMDAYKAAASLIRPPSTPLSSRKKSVNIIAERWGSARAEREFRSLRDLLARLDISINCRFLGNTDSASILRFNEASLNLPTETDETMAAIKTMLAPVSDVPFIDLPLPTGFHETREWLLAVARLFGEEDRARQIIADEEAQYRQRITGVRPALEGKTLLISTYPHSFDWICDLADDLGMVIQKAGITYSPFADTCTSRYAGRFPVANNYTVEMRSEDIRVLNPDLLLLTYPALKSTDRVRSAPIPYCPGSGFMAGVDQAERWVRLIRHPCTEGWKADGVGLP
ncbi:nitrogenase component 1 [Methanoregula sp.]|uniref:nitrogenase component 1 n=1 Tax=Methanoregula sp. TaxID=2052170 RepID=UPI002637728B|nr:nitrogenase component 1 [Methanoregula sp.]MDD5144191.1 nitrogenase component 1 [Methanoregula sp.]